MSKKNVILIGAASIAMLVLLALASSYAENLTTKAAPGLRFRILGPSTLIAGKQATITWDINTQFSARYPYEKIEYCTGIIIKKTCTVLVSSTPNTGIAVVQVHSSLKKGRGYLKFTARDVNNTLVPRFTAFSSAVTVIPVTVAVNPTDEPNGGSNDNKPHDMQTAEPTAKQFDIPTKGSVAVSNISELENLSGPAPFPAFAEVAGYFTPGDGGGGTFVLIPQGSLSINRGTIFSAKIGSNLVWKRAYSGPINVRWFGALGARPKPSIPQVNETLQIQAALNAAAVEGVRAVYAPSGTYFINQLVLTPAMSLYGDGMTDQTIFSAATGTTNESLITDDGNAAKINLRDFQVKGSGDPNSPVKYLIKLGFGAVAPHGTAGIIRSLWLRDLPGGTGIKVKGNVGNYYDMLITVVKSGFEIWGEGNIVSGIQVMGFTDKAIVSMCWFCKFNQTHIEGPREQVPGDKAANAVGIYIGRPQAVFTGVTFSLANGNDVKTLVEAPNNSVDYAKAFSIMDFTVTIPNSNTHFGHILHVSGAKDLLLGTEAEYKNAVFNYTATP